MVWKSQSENVGSAVDYHKDKKNDNHNEMNGHINANSTYFKRYPDARKLYLPQTAEEQQILERFLPAIDFLSQEGLDNIEVSNKGVVRNARTGHIYTPRMSIEGYLFVYVKFPRPIHRLVASTHQPENYRPGLVVDHKDERHNCNWNSNLEFKDQRANPVAAIGRPVTVTVVEGGKIIATFDCLKSCKDFYNGKVSGIHKKLNLGKPFDVTYNGKKLHFDVADTKFVNRQTRTFYKDSYGIRKFRDGTAKPSIKSKEVIQRKYKVETNVVEKSEIKNLFSKKCHL